MQIQRKKHNSQLKRYFCEKGLICGSVRRLEGSRETARGGRRGR